MVMYRFNDQTTQPASRSERFYQVGEKWFFAVRKGPDRGPFSSKEAARAALRTYIVEQLAEEKRNRPQGRRFSLRSLA